MAFLSISAGAYWANYRPKVYVEYRNQSGLENYMSNHEQNIGRTSAHTNDYNGNVTLTHNDLSTPGSKLPVTINHVFNNNDALLDETYNSTSNNNIRNIGYGNGFRLNLSQTIKLRTIDSYQYAEYTDEDGTRHYFIKDSINNVYKDEDGLDLTLVLNGNSFTMEDKDGNESIFNLINNTYYLKTIRDSNNNDITLNYSGELISSVKDAAGDILNLNYNNNLLTSITDPAGRSITYNYNNNNLTKITYSDNEETIYTYNNDNLITKITNIDNSSVTYEYYNTSPYRVKKVSEYGTDGIAGNYLDITYDHNITSFKDRNSYSNTYSFNDYGNVISITDFDNNNNRNNAYANSYVYGTSGVIKNKLQLESNLIKSTDNYIINNSFEVSNYWTYGQNGTTNGTCTYVADKVYVGARSVKCINSDLTSSPYYRQPLYVEKGKTYTLSGYIKTENFGTNGTGGASLRLFYNDANGRQSKTSPNIEINKDWTRYNVTFYYPETATSQLYASTQFHLKTGTIYFDEFQLEEADIANEYNLVQNGNFINNSDFWSGSNLTTDDTVQIVDNNTAFKIGGESTKNKNIKQVIPISGKAGDSFNYSFWYKNYGIPQVYALGKRDFVQIAVTDTNGVVNWMPSQKLNTTNHAWQMHSSEFIAPVDYKEIAIYFCHYKNANNLYIDNVGIFNGAISSIYSYDDKGNITQFLDNSGDNSNLIYNTNNQVTNISDNTGESADFEYDPVYKSRLIKSVSDSVTTRYSYDIFGNNIKTKNEGNDGQYIEANTEYDSTGRYITKTIDERTKETSNTYNLTRGTLSSTTNANNITTNYNYDIMDRLTGVTSKDKTNNYTYNKDKLTTINHHNINYNFVYDVFGNVNSIKINNSPLITNHYESNNGNLLSSTYGNNQTISNTYDNFNRLSTITNSSGTTTYKYDNRGNISKVIAPFQTIKFEYDINNRLIAHNENNLFNINYAYDSSSNVSKLYQLGTNTYATSNVKDSNGKITKTNIGTNSINYTYDSLNRTNTRMIKHGTKEYNTNYSFLSIDNNRTTNILKTIKNGNNEITYTYDNIGNIKSIKYNDTITHQYTYDDQNQLSIDMNPYNTINYNYDDHGNITSKEIYNPDTDTVSTIDYEYNNSNWTDQLTKYNGNTITYDEIGNPLTYGSNIAYTWQNGRELSNYTDTDKNLNVSYKYNSDGIRIEKTVNGLTTKYYLEGNKVIYEETNGDIIRYTYDSNDNRVSLNYNSNEYYYVYNGTNDIIGLLDSNLELVVKYDYDSFGKVISIKDANNDNITSNTHVGNVNPYRYKSYRYDTETETYYLQSRYYNPEIGRFINADGLVNTATGIFGHNMYTYTDNDPINGLDSTGSWTIKIHHQITNYVISSALVRRILEKYKLYNAKNLTLSINQLLVGSGYPDQKGLRASAGWHGIRQNGSAATSVILAQQYKNVDWYLKKSDIKNAFLWLGATLHTLQDSSAHYMMAGFNTGDHSSKNDSLWWDYTAKGNWVLTIPTVWGNRRARKAVSLTRAYITGFLNR